VVYEKGRYTLGDTSHDTSSSVGLQAGGQAYSEIIFLRERGGAASRSPAANFEFGRGRVGGRDHRRSRREGGHPGCFGSASVTKDRRQHAGKLLQGHGGLHVAKGGLMFEAALAGQKFNYKPRK
jgi:hypothetical protein